MNLNQASKYFSSNASASFSHKSHDQAADSNSSHSQSKIDVIELDVSTGPVQVSKSVDDDPVFLKLKGYKLYDKQEKLEAIVNFLLLLSFESAFSSGCPNINKRVNDLCRGPKIYWQALSLSE